MATSSRLRGNKNPVFTIVVGETPAASYADDLKAYGLTSEDADDSDITFLEASQGAARQYLFTARLLTSFDTGSLYGFLWDNSGAEVDIVLGPWGNVTPTATQPHFSFTATVGGKPDLSNEASVEQVGAETEVELRVVGQVSKVTA